MSAKTLLITSVLFGFLLSVAAGQCFADASAQTVRAVAPNPTGLVAHYEFEGDAVDTSGFQPPADGTLFGNPTYVAGVFGRGIDLDGEYDYVDCGNRSTFNLTGQFTVTAWIKVDKFDKMYQTIISKGDNSWRLARAGKSNRIEFACNGTAANKWNGKGEVPWAISATTDVNDGKWHHIAGVFDGSGLYLYIDGILEAAKGAAKSIGISSHNVFIGANAQVPGREWKGLIEDVRIYNYALSHAEIVSVMGKSDINLPEPVPATLCNIAKRYDGLKKCEEAKGLCQLILQSYPDSPFAGNAQIYISKRAILSLIQSKEFTTAQAEYENLIADFNDHPDLAEALYVIAQAYSPPRKFKEAESVYRQLIQLFLDSPYAVEALFRAPKIHIFYLIQSENYTDANVAIDKFSSDFDKNPALPGVIYWFAKEFEASKAYEEAQSMYQQVAWQYPDSVHASKSWIGVYKMDAISLIETGDDRGAKKIIDDLIADFTDHPDLPEAILVVGEQYFKKARQYEKQGREAEAKANFIKTIAVCERIILELSPSYTMADAYLLSGVCYRRIGQHEKAIEYYQHVVDNWPDYRYAWSAQMRIAFTYEYLRNNGIIPQPEADILIKAAFEAVVENYPKCPSAPAARSILNSNRFQHPGQEAFSLLKPPPPPPILK